MTAPLTDHERALCREAAARAIRSERDAITASGRINLLSPRTPEEESQLLYPEPAPEPKTVTFNDQQWRYNKERGDLDFRNDANGVWMFGWITAADVRAFASLLPRRELTDEIVRRATDAFWHHLAVKYPGSMRAALLSVWDDIAGPAAPAAPAPQWWGVVDFDRSKTFRVEGKEDATEVANALNCYYPDRAPHRVVALAEVPHA